MARTLDFSDHRRVLWDNRYVYPVVSRRSKGLSVGVNVNPDKACNFDCPYCQVDRREPSALKAVDLPGLVQELDGLLALAASGEIWAHAPFDTVAPHLRRVNDVAFAGDAEPFSYRGLADALEAGGGLLEDHGLSGVQPIVLSNGTLLHRPESQRALSVLDRLGGRVWFKLDAGTEPYFQFVNGTTLPFKRVLDNLLAAARARPLVIQSMFLRFHELGPSEAEIQAWLGRLQRVIEGGGEIELVQVYSIARVPARPALQMLPTPELERIAAAVRALGLEAEVYAGRPTG